MSNSTCLFLEQKGSIQDELESLRRAGGGMEEGRLLRILRGVCEGVRALHTHYPLPLTHRDIKPANIMLDVDDTPVLMDFGSMGPATVQVTTSKQARAIEVRPQNWIEIPQHLVILIIIIIILFVRKVQFFFVFK